MTVERRRFLQTLIAQAAACTVQRDRFAKFRKKVSIATNRVASVSFYFSQDP